MDMSIYQGGPEEHHNCALSSLAAEKRYMILSQQLFLGGSTERNQVQAKYDESLLEQI
jgi:hypothetical protein